MSDNSPDVLIESYLREKKLNYKETNGQYNIRPTPCCGDDKWHHFYLNKYTGLWDCKKCSAQGNFDNFRTFWGDDSIVLPAPPDSIINKPKEYRTLDYNQVRGYASALWSGVGDAPKYVEYLIKTRGLEEATLKKFRIGITAGNLSIPIFDKDDNLTNIRYRVSPFIEHEGYRYWTEKGCRSILFNEKVLTESPKEVYLTEGEFDAMHLWQRGLKFVCSTTLGAGYFAPEWVDMFRDVKRIYLCYDNDRAGREGMLKVAKKLGMDRCRIVELPKVEGRKKTDLTEYFVEDGKTLDDFKKLVVKAKMPNLLEEDVIKHITALDADLQKRLLEGEYTGLSTGYTQLDGIMGGWRKGRLVVLSGYTSVGKTSYAQNLSLNMIAKDTTTMFISLEMPPVDIYKKFIQLKARLSNKQLSEINDELHPVMGTVLKTMGEFKSMPMYVYAGTGELSLQVLMDVARTAKEVYNLQLLVVDHLGYFATSAANRAGEIATIVRKLKAMAVELDIPILLLAHVSREGKKHTRKGLYIPVMSDLKESSSIEQDADQILFVCRESDAEDDADKKKAVVMLAKNRDGATGYVSYDFEPEYQIFSEVVGANYLKESKGRKSLKDSSDEDPGEVDNPALNF